MGFFDRLKDTLGKKPEEEQRSAPRPTGVPAAEPEPEGIEVAEVTPAEFEAELANGSKVMVVDVRQQWDYRARHIPGAILMPLNSLPARYTELPPDRDIVLYCYHGITSLDGAAFLMERGFKRVRSLSGGFTQWAVEGRPTTAD
ncbi:MAG: rhodanese-like domain-containing protein [Ardenticatenaceae bacterium]|nr:rhodanese-like domain-containing protein [Ardenticatenaceae bacterium]HBY98577.1 hypothetical protein [Chloroflexota bacterium]